MLASIFFDIPRSAEKKKSPLVFLILFTRVFDRCTTLFFNKDFGTCLKSVMWGLEVSSNYRIKECVFFAVGQRLISVPSTFQSRMQGMHEEVKFKHQAALLKSNYFSNLFYLLKADVKLLAVRQRAPKIRGQIQKPQLPVRQAWLPKVQDVKYSIIASSPI